MKTWRLVFPIAVLALLIGTTLGVVWHHHDRINSSPDNCPICHLSHQVVEPTTASIRICALVPTGTGPEPRYVSFTRSCEIRHLPPRAPPA